MKAFIKGVEFEISDDKDVELLSKFLLDENKSGPSEKKLEKFLVEEEQKPIRYKKRKKLSRKERVKQAVLLADEKGISFSEASEQLGIPHCGPTYALAREFGYIGKRKKKQKRKYKVSRKNLIWTPEEDKIVWENTPKKAKKLLGRTIHAIYVRRCVLDKKKSKIGAPKKKIEAPVELSFDILSRNEQSQDKTNLYLAVIEHSLRRKSPLRASELAAVLTISLPEAKALLIDTFQQQARVFAKLNSSGKMVLSQDTLEFRLR